MSRRAATLLALVPLVALLLALAAREIDQGGILSSDTLSLLDGTAAVDACLREGELRCERGVDKWPPLQYIPALTLKRLGATYQEASDWLVRLNGLAVIGTLALLWIVAQRRAPPGLAPVAVLAGLVSPLLWYAATGFGEALAGVLTTLLVAAIVLRWNAAVVGAAAMGATLSKETAAPFVIALAVASLLLVARDDERRRRLIAGASAGIVAGLALTAAFNLFRFGVPWNSEYLQSGYSVKGLGWRGHFFAASIAAPNAGLIWFWPMATAAVAFAGVGAIRSSIRARALPGDAPPVLLAVATLLALLAGFASWWAPFGWIAYADRLIVPWVPALVLIVVVAAGPQLADATRALTRSWARVAPVAVLVVALGLPQIGAFLEPSAPIDSFAKNLTCPEVPRLVERIREGDPVAHRIHNECTAEFAWLHEPPVLLDATREIEGTRILYALLYVAAIAGLLGAARREAYG